MSGGCTTTHFEIQRMSGNIFEYNGIALFKIRCFKYGLQSKFRIYFIAYSCCRNFPLLYVMLPGTIFMAKTNFSFLASNSNFDQNFTKLSSFFRTWVEFRNEWWSIASSRHFSTTSKKPFADISYNGSTVRSLKFTVI